jgi:tetratricopeptide (TPR) repeat protein
VGDSTLGPAGSEYQSNPKVIYDGPAAGAPQIQPEPVAAPPANDSAAARQSTHRLASFRRQVNANFEKGLSLYRERRLSEAAGEFEAAVNADPNNALYLYYNALATYDQYGAEAAGDALQRAIQAERRQAVANWGQAMERIQGQGRLWIEKARRDAGLVR